MAAGPYRRPSWWQRTIGNRLAPVFGRKLVATLSVPGRTTGQRRTVPVVVLEHEGQRYLLAAFGNTSWSRNLRAAGQGTLRHHGQVEDFTAVEVPPQQRAPLIEAYLRRYGRAPGVRASFEQLPDPADHPTFRITPQP
jgi:deazaflavin-dependent oxidoreductase (nitroreductase family)